MLTLLKYEIKQTWKMCVTFLVVTLLGCLGIIFNPFNKFFIASFFYTTLLVFLVIGVSIALFFYCIGSFDQEFTQPQGYLTMTLPIKTRDLIGAKFINQLFWNLICVHIIIISVHYGVSLYGYIDLLHFQGDSIGLSNIFHLYVNGISSYVFMVLVGYFSIVTFSTQTRNNSQTLKKVILSIGLCYIVGTMINVLSFIIPYAMEYSISSQACNIIDIKRYIHDNAYHLKTANTIMKLIASYLFYVATKRTIEKKVQI